MSRTIRANLLRTLAIALAIALALTVALVSLLATTATPAEADFPAKNGRIAFASDRTTGPGVDNPTGDYEIFTTNPDGNGLKQLTINTAIDEYPAYSPNGKRIVFSTFRDGNFEIYKMKADGSNPTNLTNNPALDYEPAWQPKSTSKAWVHSG